jgi:uncharacterized protein (UPF0332 family)
MSVRCGNMQSIKWCAKINDGIKIIEPNKNTSKSFLEQAKSSLLGVQRDLENNDLLWATVKIYYAEYYSVYAFLQRIGIKCENHSCALLLAKELLDSIIVIDSISLHRKNRIDSQYYLKIGKRGEVEQMLKTAKIIYAQFDNLLSNINEKDVKEYRKNFLNLINALT